MSLVSSDGLGQATASAEPGYEPDVYGDDRTPPLEATLASVIAFQYFADTA